MTAGDVAAARQSRLGRMAEPSLQDRFAPDSRCFGCGPANPAGLRIGSRENGEELIAEWTPGPHHEAFDGVLNGGIIGTLLDCHSNWTAAMRLMRARGADRPPTCVTAEYSIRLLRPTPTGGPVSLRAWVVQAGEDRATVEAELTAGDQTTATCRGTFVAVGPGHPAYGRW
jgi:acyl-coenzyme A thioesterase PaaI-like protein